MDDGVDQASEGERPSSNQRIYQILLMVATIATFLADQPTNLLLALYNILQRN